MLTKLLDLLVVLPLPDEIPVLGRNWRTSLGGLIVAAGTLAQYFGEEGIGAGLTAIGAFLLGKSAPDKTILKQEVTAIKASVREAQAQADIATTKAEVAEEKYDIATGQAGKPHNQ